MPIQLLDSLEFNETLVPISSLCPVKNIETSGLSYITMFTLVQQCFCIYAFETGDEFHVSKDFMWEIFNTFGCMNFLVIKPKNIQ